MRRQKVSTGKNGETTVFCLKSSFFYWLWLEILYDVFSLYVKSLVMKYMFCTLIFFLLYAQSKAQISINGTPIFKIQ